MENNNTILDGGCFCKRVRYRITAPPMAVSHCHCSMCRQLTGAPFITWMTVISSSLSFTTIEPDYYRSSADVRRGFCATCGTTLAYINDHHPEELDIAAATLDDPTKVRPDDHIWVGSQLAWIEMDDGLPKLQGSHWTEGYPERNQ
jgi:hypothetical protein